MKDDSNLGNKNCCQITNKGMYTEESSQQTFKIRNNNLDLGFERVTIKIERVTIKNKTGLMYLLIDYF